jgi:hypothetical protein
MTMTRSQAGKLGSLKAAANGTQAANRRKIVEEYDKNPKRCKTCDTVIPYPKRNNDYCDHSCAARNNNRGVKRNNGKPWPIRICVECDERCKKGRKFCPSCIEKNRHIRMVTDWSEVKNNRQARKLLLKENGHRCEKCRNDIWQGVPIPLEVEHKDGDSDNWNRDNIELICPNCHALTATYKAKNRHKGSSRQVKRMKRYAEGKTY